LSTIDKIHKYNQSFFFKIGCFFTGTSWARFGIGPLALENRRRQLPPNVGEVKEDDSFRLVHTALKKIIM
jgi:hypothetical protein